MAVAENAATNILNHRFLGFTSSLFVFNKNNTEQPIGLGGMRVAFPQKSAQPLPPQFDHRNHYYAMRVIHYFGSCLIVAIIIVSSVRMCIIIV